MHTRGMTKIFLANFLFPILPLVEFFLVFQENTATRSELIKKVTLLTEIVLQILEVVSSVNKQMPFF